MKGEATVKRYDANLKHWEHEIRMLYERGEIAYQRFQAHIDSLRPMDYNGRKAYVAKILEEYETAPKAV